jgi:queuine tRNA-ribosyltransferase
VQARLGADIVMCLDECVAAGAGRDAARAAVRRTQAWAVRSRSVHGTRFATYDYPQALFGIVQGWIDAELRRESAAGLLELDFPVTPSAASPSASRNRRAMRCSSSSMACCPPAGRAT